jgi:CheY-like chemotaxis protein
MKKKLDRILLVDDDDAVNFYHKIILEEEGIAKWIDVKDSSELALDWLKHHRLPDLILLDINMPKMDGWAFIQEYRKLPKKSQNRCVIVIVSSSANPDDKQRAKETEEVAEFYSKPLTGDIVQEIMRRFFS